MPTGTLETTSKDLNPQIGMTTNDNQFLTFNLGDELYGVDILRVQEIKGYTAVTKIPNTPAHIKGVLNLRGTIVPIIELRTKFGMPTINYTAFTVIIVVVVRDKVMGLVVDSVSDVLNIDQKDIQPPPQFGAQMDVSFMNGIGKSGDKLIALLNMDRLLTDGDVPQESGAPSAT
ncbi:MAG TPA: chemotaxis protein CheW [Nitrospira sp.]|nr:chemotaxis protein CheW [Nitrospira sp.]